MRQPHEGAPVPRTPLGARLRDLRGLLARGLLFPVVEPGERLRTVTPLEGPPEQTIGEPRIFRKARAVAVGTDDLSLDRTLGLVLAIVPVADDDRPERLGLRSAVRAAAVVLASDEHAVGRLGGEDPDETHG